MTLYLPAAHLHTGVSMKWKCWKYSSWFIYSFVIKLV